MKLATWPWRGVRGLCWLLTHPPTGRHVRKLLGLIFLVMALARFDLFSFGGGSALLTQASYAWLLLVSAVWLLSTLPWRLRLVGRLAAVYSAAICSGMATDLLLQHGSVTSALNLILFTWCLLGAAGSIHEYD